MSLKNSNREFIITYKFIFQDEAQKIFEIKLDPDTLNLITDKIEHSDWTKHQNFCCPNCIQSLKNNEYCPVATNLEDILIFFSGFPSYEKIKVEVITKERTYSSITSLQTGVSSIIGILMASSGCRIMAKLKPMVKFHLPFSSLEETAYRAFSMYLLAQYYRYTNGLKPDWKLEDLGKSYEEIKKVNQYVCEKIANLELQDTTINSIIVLNNFAEFVSILLEDNSIKEFEYLFKEYLY